MSPLRRSHLLAPALLVLFAPNVARAQFAVPRDSFYPKLKVLALAPIRTPKDLENPEPVQALFAGLLEARLREAGFEVVMPDRTAPIWDSVRALQGDLFDPRTGEPDTAKQRQMRLAFARELATRFNASAVVYAGVAVRTAELLNSVAAWDGAQQDFRSKWALHMLMGSSSSGRVPALSLVVNLSALDDSDLYEWGGGIQVLQKIKPGGKPVDVPRDQLFADQKRNGKAVEIALKPLLTGKS